MDAAGPRQAKAFISYAHQDRKYGGQAKAALAEVGIVGFLAHEDLEVSDEWRERIVEELRTCDLFVALLSAYFLASMWAPQEAGFIISRPEVIIAPLSIDGTLPCGFLSHLQSRKIPPTGISREVLVEPLARRMPRTILPALIRSAARAGSFRIAEARMKPLVPLFSLFTADEAQALAQASVENGQIWSAALCRSEYLPELIRIHAVTLKPETLRALQYQIENERWSGSRQLPEV
jgi:TIR domain